ncbi:cytochrome c [Piscinibacter sp. HJYY11]|uniref:c-type cytochrome n=1 Tax=Piscinibacter sp. HJYY11 TaxID=2801333 RepID=UPI00191D1153|nr:c-type cytochrome [Piscinibacter sp. HJYY11]MBL0726331.1 c-type cytochrome [Piscinibacter sp. HJYY11]
MKRAWLVVLVLVLLAGAVVVGLNLRGEDPLDEAPVAATPELIQRGEYLARAGNCAGCHTERGGVPYAGGRGIDTPFGTIYSPNLTPDAATGLGQWSASHFWRAMHNGRSRDGRLLSPAFPYTNYTLVTRADSDAIYAYLRSLPPVAKPNREHSMRFPYGTQAALAVWRALYFKPETHTADASQSAAWNRGAYLVRGLGHCNACHGHRNALGATGGTLDLSGGLIPVQNWYAPSLSDPHEAGVGNWPPQEVATLLKTGMSPRASVLGPMAEVVLGSTQHLRDDDLLAMGEYLRSLPPSASRATSLPGPSPDQAQGKKLYDQHCAGCHGDAGEGAKGIYPALAGNRAVTMATPANLVRVLMEGGFAPSTAGNPRPFGMPPFAGTLNDDDMAAVLSHVRSAWGNQAPPVSAFEVSRYRER